MGVRFTEGMVDQRGGTVLCPGLFEHFDNEMQCQWSCWKCDSFMCFSNV